MNRYSFATALGWPDDEVLARLRALDLSERCSRCSGKGHVGVERTDETRCFKCAGAGDQLPKLSLKLCRNVAERVVKGDLHPYLRKKRRDAACTRATPTMIADCKQLSRRIEALGLPDGHPALASAAELVRGQGALVDVEALLQKNALDPETACVRLSSIREKLTALLISTAEAS